MREILFRGKRIDSGEWVYGGYKLEKIGGYITAVFIIEPLTDGVFENHRVIPKTVGQYTGLEANGKKIFEGDIVNYEDYVYYCKWDEYNYEYAFDDGDEDFGIGYTAPYDLEIIGNIHDNPELLKGGEIDA